MNVRRREQSLGSSLKGFYENQYPRGTELAQIPRADDFMYAQILKQIRPYMGRPCKVLDIGCNKGTLCLFMARAGCNVLGIEIAQNAVELARASAEKYNLPNASFQAVSFEDWDTSELFDLVLCSHVIEHVPQDDLFARKVARRLKPNGHLVLFTPTAYSSLYRVAKRLTGHYAFDEEVGHLRRYTRESLTGVLSQAGLKIEQVVFLDGMLRDWFILFKPLSVMNFVLSRRYIRSAFNYVDSRLAPFLFPATLCIHARRPEDMGGS